MKKIEIIFESGESRRSHGVGCNYMIGHVNNAELYAEVIVTNKEYEKVAAEKGYDFADYIGHDELKRKIIEQAKECGIKESELEFIPY